MYHYGRWISLCVLLTTVITGCQTTGMVTADRDPETYANEVCEKFSEPDIDAWDILSDDPKEIDMLTEGLAARYEDDQQRNIAVFLDGTANDFYSETNIWKLYTFSVKQACTGEPVLPYYHIGVGTLFGTQLLGGVFGRGLGEYIKTAYAHVAKTYKPSDKIFLFGFSRGAFMARSLNGMIEFAGLLQADAYREGSDGLVRNLKADTARLYALYNRSNDGMPYFESRHKFSILSASNDLPIYRGDAKVVVEAIGVFDTVPALGFGRDDNPDDHRTALYAREGYHALAMDEQRNDFRLLRFNDVKLDPAQTLEEVWFAGAHADVGGGYLDERGLEWISRSWMLERFVHHGIFPAAEAKLTCDLERGDCEAGPLHDEFLPPVEDFLACEEQGEQLVKTKRLLKKSVIFEAMGLSWRLPKRDDHLHGSVLCRSALGRDGLVAPHPGRECYGYNPRVLYQPIEASYNVLDYDCTADQAALGAR